MITLNYKLIADWSCIHNYYQVKKISSSKYFRWTDRVTHLRNSLYNVCSCATIILNHFSNEITILKQKKLRRGHWRLEKVGEKNEMSKKKKIDVDLFLFYLELIHIYAYTTTFLFIVFTLAPLHVEGDVIIFPHVMHQPLRKGLFLFIFFCCATPSSPPHRRVYPF